jgi:2'-5' RNA ligase
MSRCNIGVAIAVPEPYRPRLQRWRERFGDPNAGKIVPHVTLLPPTVIKAERLPVVEEHLAGIARREKPFEIELRGSATFRPVSPVVFVPLVAGISDCERLEHQVRSGPLDREVRYPYHPHVTVAHDVPDDVLDQAYGLLSSFTASFTVHEFALFEQQPDEMWRPARGFPLTGARTDGSGRSAQLSRW